MILMFPACRWRLVALNINNFFRGVLDFVHGSLVPCIYFVHPMFLGFVLGIEGSVGEGATDQFGVTESIFLTTLHHATLPKKRAKELSNLPTTAPANSLTQTCFLFMSSSTRKGGSQIVSKTYKTITLMSTVDENFELYYPKIRNFDIFYLLFNYAWDMMS